MAETTGIAWTTSTFNPWIGCTRVGPGCVRCYAELMDSRKRWDGGKTHWGSGVPRYRTSEANWRQPLAWNKKAAASGKPWRVFCASLADVFDNEVPDEWRSDLFSLVAQTSSLSWLLVTKRLGNVARMVPYAWTVAFPANVRLLISVCNQEEADRDIPKLLALPCKNGISYEPALGPVDWTQWLGGEYNPVYEKQTERRVRLPVGPERRFGDQPERGNLEGAKARVGSLETNGGESPLQTSEGGTRSRGLFSGEGDVGREASLCAGSPAGVPTPERTYTGRVDRESQGRQEKEERAKQPGTGDTFGADSALGARVGNGSMREPRRHEERNGEIDAATGEVNSSSQGQGRAVALNSGRLRDQISGGIQDSAQRSLGKISWIICGGESGPKARPFDLAWARSTVQQCKDAGVPVFVKQLGRYPMPESDDLRGHRSKGHSFYRGWPLRYCDEDEHIAVDLKDRAGADQGEWPEDLRVQQFPT